MGNNNSLLLHLTPHGGDLPLWLAHTMMFISWKDRCSVIMLNWAFNKCSRSDKFWRFFITRISFEHGVYVPTVLPSMERSWRHLFMELHSSLKEISWNPETHTPSTDSDNEQVSATTQKPKEERFKISVFARFRPDSEPERSESVPGVPEANDGQAVVLPLHQRLSMIRMSGKASSNRAALRVLASEGEWFQAKWSSLKNKEKVGDVADENVSNKAYLLDADSSLNLRQGEKQLDFIKANPERVLARVQSLDSGMGRVVMVAPDVGLREFSFDGVLPLECPQSRVYDMSTRRLVMDFVNGYNATCIAYGQTGSGKTYSMFGPAEFLDSFAHTHASPSDATRGIVPRACQEIISAISHPSRRAMGVESTIGVSYVEIFGDYVSDLLSYGARCGQSKVASQRFVLSGAAEHKVNDLNDVYSALKIGEQSKRRAATAMNERSSRAHSLFIITLHQKSAVSGVERHSRLFMADLGGSEQVKKSGVEAGGHKQGVDEQFSAGFEKAEHMREAVNINLGLLALKKCIDSLNNKSCYCPYQDSKLTMLLSQGLGGNSKTSVIICGSMSPKHAAETVATLRFGERCALVENESRNNSNMLASVLAELDGQITRLEATIKLKERWEVIEEVRTDSLAEANTLEAAIGGREVKKVSQLVGAETERKLLETLLIRRASFTGSSSLEDLAISGDGDKAAASSLSTCSFANEKRKKVVGFGSKSFFYGLGEAFDASQDAATENERFSSSVDVNALSSVVRKKGSKGWTKTEELQESAEKLEARAKKINRSKLVYSGISA